MRQNWILSIDTYHNDLTVTTGKVSFGKCTEFTIGSRLEKWAIQNGFVVDGMNLGGLTYKAKDKRAYLDVPTI